MTIRKPVKKEAPRLGWETRDKLVNLAHWAFKSGWMTFDELVDALIYLRTRGDC